MSERSYHATKFFAETLLAIEMKKKNKKTKQRYLWIKPAYLGLSILELSKILMYEFWCDYVKPKYGEKDTDSLIVYLKTNDSYKDILEDVETRFDTSDY